MALNTTVAPGLLRAWVDWSRFVLMDPLHLANKFLPPTATHALNTTVAPGLLSGTGSATHGSRQDRVFKYVPQGPRHSHHGWQI